ncbi:MAG: DUF4783 domain-containing protein [Bacteroidales bacterium]|nr:DUF4783 domain-containing protein [Bacteroidales bacterium]
MSAPSRAQQLTSDDVLTPISKYIAKGDAQKLSAWFSSSIEVGIFKNDAPTSKAQARQIMKTFFKNYPPRSFEFIHKASKGNGKYAIGTLNAGGENFTITIFTAYNEKYGDFRIQQISISR